MRIGTAVVTMGALLMSQALVASAAPGGVKLVVVDGEAQIGHDEAWRPAQVGDEIAPGDGVRTAAGGRARLVIGDGAMVTLHPSTHFIFREHATDAEGKLRTLLQLSAGKVRAVVSPEYGEGKSLFQIETATAAARVKGTEFVIAFDPVADASDVVGLNDEVSVQAAADVKGQHIVVVHARELTQVARGAYPTAPKKLSEELVKQYIEGLDFILGGRTFGVLVEAIATGDKVPESERAEVVIADMPIGDSGPISFEPPPFDDKPPTDPGEALGQPPAQVIEQGEAGIRF